MGTRLRILFNDIDERFQKAVKEFWGFRRSQQDRQLEAGKQDAGTRGSVTGGGHMESIELLIYDSLLSAGVPKGDIHIRKALELPGYYRPEKKWDLLVIKDNQLLLCLELKSQVGSFGNNFNNRSEEAIGNAEDFWTSFREGYFGKQVPLLGFLFLLEDVPKVHTKVKVVETNFKVDPVFVGSGYAKRYQVLMERLVLERKYTTTCLTLTTRGNPSRVTFPCESHSFRQFVLAIEAHVSRFYTC